MYSYTNYILSANGWLAPVTRNFTGECFALLIDVSVRLVDLKEPSSFTRSESSGSCSTGGHFGAIGRGHWIGQSSPQLCCRYNSSCQQRSSRSRSRTCGSSGKLWSRAAASLRAASTRGRGSRRGSSWPCSCASADWQCRTCQNQASDKVIDISVQ